MNVTISVKSRVTILLIIASLFMFQVGCSSLKHNGKNESIKVDQMGESNFVPPKVNFDAFRGQGKLAFIWDGRLYVLDGDRGTLEKISEPGRAGSLKWSMDGEWLAYVCDDNHLQVARSDASELYDVAGLPKSLYHAPVYTWSPAANVLAIIPDMDKGGIYLLQPGETLRQLTAVHTGVASFSWATDGKTIAYVDTLPYDPNDPVNRVNVLYNITVEGGVPARLYAAKGAAIRLAGWQPSNEEVLFWLSPGHSASQMADGLQLYSLPLASDKPRFIATTLLYPEWLTWSPDATKLVVVAGEGREIWQNKSLVLYNSEQGNSVYLPQRSGTVRLYPEWSPDGKWISFLEAIDLNKIKDVEGGKIAYWRQTKSLWIADADGSNARRIEEAGQGMDRPCWSSDSRHILYLKDNAVWLIDIDGGSPVRVVGPFPEQSNGYISWNDKLAYYQN